MDLQQLSASLLTPARVKALEKCLKDHKIVKFVNVAGSSAPMALAQIKRSEPILVIGDSADDAGYLYHDLSRICTEEAVAIIPSGYKRDIKYGQIDPPSQILRTEALNRWNTDKALRFVITYPEAMAERVATRQEIKDSTLSLKVGQEKDMRKIEKWLLDNGFVEVDYVYEPGQVAIRGSILDVFAYSYELPYRIDFFGDEIDSIRSFNIETQLSEQRFQEVSLCANLDQEEKGVSLLEFISPKTLIAVRDYNYTIDRIKAIANENFSDSALIANEGDVKAMEKVIDPDGFAERFQKFRRIEFTAGDVRRGEYSYIPDDELETERKDDDKEKEKDKDRPYIEDAIIEEETDHKGMTIKETINDGGKGEDECDDCGCLFDFECSPQGIYHKNFELISQSFTKFLKNGYTIYILSDSAKQIQRLKVIFEERGDKIDFTPVITTLHEGFVDHLNKRCIFTDHQIFDRFHKYSLKSDRARSGKLALSLKELNSIEVGDYIVHVDHGVGKFAGLLRTSVNGHMQEMIKLVYQNDDSVFVSIHGLHKLSKYRGKEGVPPRLNKLGSGAWNRTKEKTKSRLKDIARDLIRLYAARKEEQGFAFSPDSYLQQELEASFIYEDTPDQLTATQAVKADMESNKPMDRLICGDVGFGKTEIAIRAAFKAATDGKQTAVLVPTTVLAYQHYNTFSERLKDFPVRVEYLSRARTAKETKAILKDLAEGNIDILIGTHKIIGKDVHFKDLGLLVVDEEQKFGVAVKEKLKQLKINVDTLTMSATPIPRTLQFSLMGARDLSSLTTPPANRHPIVTSVNAFNEDILSEAINFELSRNGQVFIINNRIEGLYQLEETVKKLVPDARVIVAHGQMPPEKLEKAIVDFAAHDYDILIATTILESGIDMPNVNTIIVNGAQNFGLSELHQLRGRVGRSSRKAFCYLLVPPHVPLSPVARRRLQAIESFSDLGSGIHIAMQDLDIRGAGNLLGAEQSGFIADLGYETYQRILKEAVIELKTEEFADVFQSEEGEQKEEEFVTDCTIESDLELLLPDDYVPQESERIALYRELDSIERDLDLEAFRVRLQDRFGKIPHETAELLLIPRLRRKARQLGIEKVSLKQGQMFIYFVGAENIAYYKSPMFGKLLHYLQINPKRVKIRDVNQKRSFAIQNVTTVESALNIIETILSLPSL